MVFNSRFFVLVLIIVFLFSPPFLTHAQAQLVDENIEGGAEESGNAEQVRPIFGDTKKEVEFFCNEEFMKRALPADLQDKYLEKCREGSDKKKLEKSVDFWQSYFLPKDIYEKNKPEAASSGDADVSVGSTEQNGVGGFSIVDLLRSLVNKILPQAIERFGFLRFFKPADIAFSQPENVDTQGEIDEEVGVEEDKGVVGVYEGLSSLKKAREDLTRSIYPAELFPGE